MTGRTAAPVGDDRPVVAFVTHSAQLAGAELFLLRVTAVMRRIRPLVVLGEHGPLEAALAERGVDTVVVPLSDSVRSHTATASIGPGLARKGIGVVAAARALAALCRARGVALIASQSAKSHLYAGLAGRLASRPVVVHQHFVIGGVDARRANALVLRAVIAATARLVIANSGTTAASVGRWRPVTVVGCPVDQDVAPAPEPPGPPRVLVLGRLSEVKGQDLAVRAFARARTLGLPRGARMRIVGAALFARDVPFEAALRALVADSRLTEAVEFAGHVDDVRAELDRSTVVVHAGRVAEGFGQAVAESMAAGRAVVVSDLGAAAELVRPDAGVLVPADDVEALAHAIRALVADDERRAAITRAARERVRAFEPGLVVGALEQALLSALR